MTHDILIAGVMVAFSVTGLLGIILLVSRAVREEPRAIVREPEKAPVLRPASGW